MGDRGNHSANLRQKRTETETNVRLLFNSSLQYDTTGNSRGFGCGSDCMSNGLLLSKVYGSAGF